MNRMIYIGFVSIMFLTSVLIAQQFSANIRVNDDPAGKSQRAPVIRIDNAGTMYIAWIDHRNNPNGDIYFSKSSDGGKTFSPNRIVYAGGSVNANFQRTAYFAIDNLGRLHFVWLENKIKNQPDIWYCRSLDGGITFSTPISVSGDSSKYAQDFPSIATDSLNNVYICFLDSRETQQGLSKNVQLYFTKSTDGGSTFSQPVRATNMPDGIGGTCECCRTSMVVSASGHVYIAFRSNINDRRDIFIACSLDGGRTFEKAIPMASEQWIISACPVTGPSITLDREETAHVVWRDNRPSSGKSTIYYSTLYYNDTVAVRDMRISDSPQQTDYPTISINGAMIFVVHQDRRNDLNDVFYTYSLDGGNTFFPGKKLSDDQTTTRQEFPDCAFDKTGNRYAVWQDARRDDGDIYFSKDTSRVGFVRPEAVNLLTPDDESTISTFDMFTWEMPTNVGMARHVLYDVIYQKSGESPTMTRNLKNTFFQTELSPGKYIWSVHARSLVGVEDYATSYVFTLQPPTNVSGDEDMKSFYLAQNYPNPFSVQTTIIFGQTALGKSFGQISNYQSIITFKIYDLFGREVMDLSDKSRNNSGIRITRSQLPHDGVYVYTLTTGNERLTKKMVVR